MATLNRVFLLGNLTRDPEVRFVPSGSAVADIRLAVNRKYKTAGGEERGGSVGSEPLQALGVAGGGEVAVRLEVGDREGEQSGGEDLLEFEGGHGTKEG